MPGLTLSGLQSLSVLKSLISNSLTPANPPWIVIEAILGDRSHLVPGALAWSTMPEQITTGFSPTQKPFSAAVPILGGIGARNHYLPLSPK